MIQGDFWHSGPINGDFWCSDCFVSTNVTINYQLSSSFSLIHFKCLPVQIAQMCLYGQTKRSKRERTLLAIRGENSWNKYLRRTTSSNYLNHPKNIFVKSQISQYSLHVSTFRVLITLLEFWSISTFGVLSFGVPIPTQNFAAILVIGIILFACFWQRQLDII